MTRYEGCVLDLEYAGYRIGSILNEGPWREVPRRRDAFEQPHLKYYTVGGLPAVIMWADFLSDTREAHELANSVVLKEAVISVMPVFRYTHPDGVERTVREAVSQRIGEDLHGVIEYMRKLRRYEEDRSRTGFFLLPRPPCQSSPLSRYSFRTSSACLPPQEAEETVFRVRLKIDRSSMATAPDDAMCIPGLVDDLPEDELDRLFPRAGILPASPRIQSGPVLVVKAWSRIRSALRKKRHDASAGPTGYQDSVIFLEMLSLLLIMKLCKEHGEHSMYPGHTDWAEVNWLPLQRELDTVSRFVGGRDDSRPLGDLRAMVPRAACWIRDHQDRTARWEQDGLKESLKKALHWSRDQILGMRPLEDDRHHMEVHTLGKPHSRYVAQDRRVLERS